MKGAQKARETIYFGFEPLKRLDDARREVVFVLQGLRHGLHTRQRVADFMRQSHGQFTQGRELFHLKHLPVQFPALILKLTLLADIARDDNETGGGWRHRQGDHLLGQLHITSQLPLHGVRRNVGPLRPKLCHAGARCNRLNTKQSFCGRVEKLNAPFPINRQNAVSGVLDHSLQRGALLLEFTGPGVHFFLQTIAVRADGLG